MRKPVLALAALAALVAMLLPVSWSGAQDTTDVYVAHGLNLSDQGSADEGGTPVTVCADGTSLIDDFQFGDIVGPVALTSGVTVGINVYDGAGVDCGDPGGAALLIDQDVTPEGAAVALVATSQGDQLQPELLPFALDQSCHEPGTGRLTAAHAANAPTVDVLVDGEDVADLDYGESFTADLPADTYSVQVDLQGDGTIVGPVDLPVQEGVHTAVIVVGNQPVDLLSPVVPLVLDVELDECEQPTTTTTTTTGAPTTTAPAPAPVAPIAQQQPAFTG